MPLKRSTPQAIYQIKVTLLETDPPIWRRFQISGDIRLSRLHDVLQIVMGWEDYHLHQFLIDKTRYGIPDPDFGSDLPTVEESKVKLGQVADREKMRFIYEYDFGDSWQHELRVEKIFPPEPGADYPVCIAGERSAPPEDCGGVWGYADFLEAISDPDHPEHDAMLEWVGGEFDPEAFDLEEVNRRLQRIGQTRRRNLG